MSEKLLTSVHVVDIVTERLCWVMHIDPVPKTIYPGGKLRQ